MLKKCSIKVNVGQSLVSTKQNMPPFCDVFFLFCVSAYITLLGIKITSTTEIIYDVALGFAPCVL